MEGRSPSSRPAQPPEIRSLFFISQQVTSSGQALLKPKWAQGSPGECANADADSVEVEDGVWGSALLMSSRKLQMFHTWSRKDPEPQDGHSFLLQDPQGV